MSTIVKGTTIIVLGRGDSIVIAADKRAVWYYHGKIIHHNSASKKIFNIGKIFFIHAGPTEFNGVSFESMIKSICDTNLSIKKNVDIINAKLKSEYQKFFNSLNIDEKAFYNEEMVSHYSAVFFIITFIKKTPTIYELDFRVEKNKYPSYTNYGYEIFDTIPILDTSRLVAKVRGFNDHVIDTLLKGFRASDDPVSDCIKMITIEARHHIEVDSNVDYAIIKQNSFKYGKNYK